MGVKLNEIKWIKKWNRRNKIITRAIPGNLPDAIEIDISELKIGMFCYLIQTKHQFHSFSFLVLQDELILVYNGKN